MSVWFCYAVGAAVLYGAHQIFIKLAADESATALAHSSSRQRRR